MTKKIAFIDAIMTGATVAQAAKAAGVTDRTGYTWLHLPEVKDQLRQAQTTTINVAGLRLVALVEGAIDALADVLDRPSAPGQNNKRLAAVSMLEIALKWRQAVDYEERILELERLVKKDG